MYLTVSDLEHSRGRVSLLFSFSDLETRSNAPRVSSAFLERYILKPRGTRYTLLHLFQHADLSITTGKLPGPGAETAREESYIYGFRENERPDTTMP